MLDGVSKPELGTAQGLLEVIRRKGSFLCVGLDPDPEKIPSCFGVGVKGMETFCKAIIDATSRHAVAFKPNLAFFEQYGAEGWSALSRIIAHMPEDVLCIADAKRGDIGNTASKYAKAMFDGLGADAVTIAPYMGRDSVEPFTAFEGKWTVLLALTSNASADDFEFHGEPPLFERVLAQSKQFEHADRLMYVVGATRPDMLQAVRAIVPDAFLLVPGVGAQGGSLEEVVAHGMNQSCGLLVNSSRGILYAGGGDCSMEEALAASEQAAADLAQSMRSALASNELL